MYIVPGILKVYTVYHFQPLIESLSFGCNWDSVEMHLWSTPSFTRLGPQFITWGNNFRIAMETDNLVTDFSLGKVVVTATNAIDWQISVMFWYQEVSDDAKFWNIECWVILTIGWSKNFGPIAPLHEVPQSLDMIGGDIWRFLVFFPSPYVDVVYACSSLDTTDNPPYTPILDRDAYTMTFAAGQTSVFC